MQYTLSPHDSVQIGHTVADQLKPYLSDIISHMPDAQHTSFIVRWQWAHHVAHMVLHGMTVCRDASPLEELEAEWGAHWILWPAAGMLTPPQTIGQTPRLSDFHHHVV